MSHCVALCPAVAVGHASVLRMHALVSDWEKLVDLLPSALLPPDWRRHQHTKLTMLHTILRYSTYVCVASRLSACWFHL